MASALGSPLDAVMRIEGDEGKLIKEVDDTKTSPDPEYLWTVPSEGTYSISVGDRFRRFGDGFRFLVVAEEAVPDFKATVAQTEFAVKKGETAEVAVTVTRLHGHTVRLKGKVVGLPEGVSAEFPDVPEKDGEVKVKLVAKKDAKPFNGSVRVELIEEVEGDAKPKSKAALFAFKKDAPYGAYLIEETGDLWLTVPE